jgi:hypothetical protein
MVFMASKARETKSVPKTTRVTETSEDKSKEPQHEAGSDLFGVNIDLAETTSKVVQQAASILETEVAAGIALARKIEEQFINTEKLRSEKPEEVMARFRRDAHEVVDIFADIGIVSMKYMYDVSKKAITIRSHGAPAKSEKTSGEQLPVIKVAQAVRAGEASSIPMSLDNSGDMQTDEFKFHNTDLVSGSGERILAHHVTFEPPSLKIDPHKTVKVVIAVNVPKETPPGMYTGLILVSSTYQLHSELVVQVE